MSVSDPTRLARLLGDGDLAWLVRRIRRRLERGHTLNTTVTLADPTPAQRAAVHRLLGRRPQAGHTLTVSLTAVDQVVRQSGVCEDGLAAAVIALTGPVTDKAAAAAASERAWREAFAPLDAVVRHHPQLADWYATIRDTGLVRRLAGTAEVARPLLTDLAAIVQHLPAVGEPLGRFAARVTGQGAHALDDNRPLATLALGAARALSGIPEGTGTEWRREI